MRQAGRITGWNDAKGFGFVTPHNGGARAFVHVKAFQAAARRPVDGDLVSYATRTDGKGRVNAIDVRFAGQRADVQAPMRRASAARLPRTAMGACALAAALGLMVTGAMPALLALVYLLMSTVTWIAYALDKDAAGKPGRQRTPEGTLHLLELLGGWPGALLAQGRLRHKTVKQGFQVEFWFAVIGNVAAAAWLWRSGWAARLSELLVG